MGLPTDMTNLPLRTDSIEPPKRADGGLRDRRRALELQLITIRNEAAAARLEARAAEIELLIFQLGATEPRNSVLEAPELGDPELGDPELGDPEFGDQSGRSRIPGRRPLSSTPAPGAQPPGIQRFSSWQEVSAAIDQSSPNVALPISESPPQSPEKGPPKLTPLERGRSDEGQPEKIRPEKKSSNKRRPEKGEAVVGTPLQDRTLPGTPVLSKTEPTALAAGVESDASQSSRPEASAHGSRKKSCSAAQDTPVLGAKRQVILKAVEENSDDPRRKRSKPAAWMLSAVAHFALLLLLAGFTLQSHRPKDQVSLLASPVQANETSMETFTIENSEPETQPSEATPTDTQYDLSPDGEIAAIDFSPDRVPQPPSSAVASLGSQDARSAAAMSPAVASDAKIQFCGVEGGGNHFVYLVDSSGSMGDAFDSARSELLQSIDVLKPHQRFYVVFFDADSDYMRLTNTNENEPRSVEATAANKAALRRWAMRVSTDRGKAPYEPLEFALRLRPDVIFLLSDGEFPQGIEDLLRAENRVENLFGEKNPISIVHTIGYFSKEGENRMRRIATQNKGQYRYVPKP